jgi:hypothetical protein
MTLSQAATKSRTNFSRASYSRDLRDGSQLGVRAGRDHRDAVAALPAIFTD